MTAKQAFIGAIALLLVSGCTSEAERVQKEASHTYRMDDGLTVLRINSVGSVGSIGDVLVVTDRNGTTWVVAPHEFDVTAVRKP